MPTSTAAARWIVATLASRRRRSRHRRFSPPPLSLPPPFAAVTFAIAAAKPLAKLLSPLLNAFAAANSFRRSLPLSPPPTAFAFLGSYFSATIFRPLISAVNFRPLIFRPLIFLDIFFWPLSFQPIISLSLPPLFPTFAAVPTFAASRHFRFRHFRCRLNSSSLPTTFAATIHIIINRWIVASLGPSENGLPLPFLGCSPCL